jgi:hypothetical protein
MAGFYLRGALIEFMESFPIPIPNVIIFQYNPETMTHTWTPATTNPNTPGSTSNPLAVTGSPQESFSFTLAMDSNDMIADGDAVETGIATVSGVYSRLASLEMLLFPTAPPGGGLIGSVTAALGLGGGSSSPDPTRQVPAAQLPTVLFIWGPGRIVPVRVTTLTITEKLYDATLLNPTHVEAQVGLRVLTQEELKYVDGPLGSLANIAYTYSQGLREALAIANLANAAESIIGMLPV